MSDAAGRLFIEIDADYAKFVQSWTEIAVEAETKAKETAVKVTETITAEVTKSIEETAAQVMASQDEMWARQVDAIQRHMAKIGDLPIPGLPGQGGAAGGQSFMDRFFAPSSLTTQKLTQTILGVGKGLLLVEAATRAWDLATAAVQGRFDDVDAQIAALPFGIGRAAQMLQGLYQFQADALFGVRTDSDLFSESAGAARVAAQRQRQQTEIERLARVEELERLAVIAGVADEEERRRLEIENTIAVANAEARRRVASGEDYYAVERERRAVVEAVTNAERVRQQLLLKADEERKQQEIRRAEEVAAAEFQIDLRTAEMLDQFYEQQRRTRMVEEAAAAAEVIRNEQAAIQREMTDIGRISGENFVTRASTAIGSFAFGDKNGPQQIVAAQKRTNELTQRLVELEQQQLELQRNGTFR